MNKITWFVAIISLASIPFIFNSPILVLVLIFGLVVYLSVNITQNGKETSAARKLWHRKLLSFESYSIDTFFSDIGFDDREKYQAYTVLSILANALEVPVEILAHDYKLADIMLIDLPSYDKSNRLDLFSDDVLENITPLLDKDELLKKHAELPKNKKEYGADELILSMTISEFLHFYVPLLKQNADPNSTRK
jgi:hypothetical protein